jgi:HSP20 family molecular chaperone IbpA
VCDTFYNIDEEICLIGGGIDTSAKWRRSNKNRKWLDFNTPTKPRKQKINDHQPKTITLHSSFRPSKSFAKRNFEEPKPLIDIFQENNYVVIVAEIAGFNKETFKINVKDQKITLSAKSKDRRYYKSLNLPKVVIPNAMHTKYKNGVLEIKLKKAETTINKEANQNAT